MLTAPRKPMNRVNPISTFRWDGPVPPASFALWLILVPQLDYLERRPRLLGGEEAGGLHQVLMRLFGLRDPVEILFAAHEGLIERAVIHEFFPLRRFAHF